MVPLDKPDGLTGGAGQARGSAREGYAARQQLVYQLPVLKGVAVLAVVATHASASIWRPFLWPLVPEVFVNTLARFAVPLFVVLSGFYLSLNTRNQRPVPFYRRTLPGLVWPYVCYTIVYAAVRTGSWHAFVDQVPEFLRHGSASPHLWFIPVIVELYLVHPWLRRAYERSSRPLAFVGALFAVQAAYAFVYELVLRPAGPFTGWHDAVVSATSFGRCIGFFGAGYALCDHAAAVLEGARRRGSSGVAMAVWLGVGAVLPALWVAQEALDGAVSPAWLPTSRIALELLTVPLTGAALILLVARDRWPRVPRSVAWAARTSGLYAYGIYYLHPLVLTGVAHFYWTHARPLMTPGPLRAALLFATVSLGTIYAVKLLTRIPLTRRLA